MKLLILTGSHKYESIPCSQKITIGRSSENDIVINKKTVSNMHAEILDDNGFLVIRDLESHNGISLNGKKIDESAPLEEGDQIRVGPYEFKLVADDYVVDPELIKAAESSPENDPKNASDNAPKADREPINENSKPDDGNNINSKDTDHVVLSSDEKEQIKVNHAEAKIIHSADDDEPLVISNHTKTAKSDQEPIVNTSDRPQKKSPNAFSAALLNPNKMILLVIFTIFALLQLFFPYYTIYQSESINRDGTEFKFKTIPVDPNDPFRGKYVTLNFALSSATVDPTIDWQIGTNAYLILLKDEKGYAVVKSVSILEPQDTADYLEINIRRHDPESDTIHFTLPFNRFYMEESKAYPAEQLYREHQTGKSESYALVNIMNGKFVLTNLMIDDKSIHQLLEEQ